MTIWNIVLTILVVILGFWLARLTSKVKIGQTTTSTSSKMRMLNPQTPLWLPPGSVRAILVLLFAVAIIFPVFKFVVYHEEIPQTVVQVLSLLFGGLIAIVKDYFVLRSQQEQQPQPPPQGG